MAARNKSTVHAAWGCSGLASASTGITVSAMVTHIVLFRFASPKDADEAVLQLLSMRGRIGSLLEIEAGVDFSRGERSYEVGLITRHASREDLLAYQADPVHQAVAAFIKSRSMGAAAVDFEAT